MEQVMKYYFLVLLLLVGCGSDNSTVQPPVVEVPPVVEPPIEEPKELSITRYDLQTTWYELPSYFEGIPAYSGASGTGYAKTSPTSVSCDLGNWATASNNRDGNLGIYVVNLDTGVSGLVHTEVGLDDPHQNAAIQCGGGKLWLAVSARGYKREGSLYSSVDGESWELLSNQMWSYPQLHWVNGSLLFLYSEYTISENIVDRHLYSSCNNEKIVDDGLGHYSMSYYDGSTVHVVYNDHVNGSNGRTNLNYKKSDDGGCTWSASERWYNGDLVFLKDLNIVNGEITALVVLSDSYDPNYGTRQIAKVTASGTAIDSFTNHNYTTGAINSNGEIIFPSGTTKYAGGQYLDAPYINYIKRIHGGDGYVASEGISAEYQSDAWLVKID